MAERPTLESLAAELGVSRQTVSNVINRPERVAPATLERVRAAVEAAGYVPTLAARQLRTARSHALAFRLMPTFDGINGHILDAFLHELADHARRAGYSLALFSAEDEDDEMETYERMVAARSIDGVVLTSTHLDDPRPDHLLALGIPFVAFGRPWSVTADPFDAPFDWVDVDGAAGTEAVTRRLVEEGHRRIGYISWPLEPGVGCDRWDGWRRAVDESGLATEELAVYCPDGADQGRQAAHTLLARGATALVCASDTLALGAARAVSDLGGGRVVVGFDNTPVARELSLNSVVQPVAEAARTALGLLLRRIDGDQESRHVLLPPTPVFRDRTLSGLMAEPEHHQR